MVVVDAYLAMKIFGDYLVGVEDYTFDGRDDAFALQHLFWQLVEGFCHKGGRDDKVDVVAFFHYLAQVAADVGAVGVDVCLTEIKRVVLFAEKGGYGLFFAHPPVYFAVLFFEQYFYDCCGPTATS